MRPCLSAAAIISLITATAGCRPARPAERRDLVPELVMEGVTFRVDRQGESRAMGEASRVTYRRDTTAVTASGLGLLLSEAGQGPIRIIAPSGEGVVAERRFDATGGILAERGTDRATTGSAHFTGRGAGDGEPSGATIRGDDPVVVEGPGYRLTGTGFRLDPSAHEITIGRGAHLIAGLGGRR